MRSSQEKLWLEFSDDPKEPPGLFYVHCIHPQLYGRDDIVVEVIPHKEGFFWTKAYLSQNLLEYPGIGLSEA